MSDLALDRIIISGIQTRYKDSYASAPGIGLTTRCNGEEPTSVIDSSRNVVRAGIEAPTVVPTLTQDTGGTLTDGKFVAYVYVYAATRRYPLVESVVTGGGSLAPRSNPSPPSVSLQLSGAAQVTVTVATTSRVDISEIWIYRTTLLPDVATCDTAALAGELFYCGTISNNHIVSTVTFLDNTIGSGEQVESDNFLAPTGQFVVFEDPYFWMFGGPLLEVPVTVTRAGLINITDGTKWYSGRTGNSVKLQGIDIGGADGLGTFYFQYLSSSTAQLSTDTEGLTSATVPFEGTTIASIKFFSTTLWRSKPRNPFSWGFSTTVGESVIAQEYAFKIGGGVGSALTIIPDSNLLKLDTEQPSASYVLSLASAGTDSFESTLRSVSKQYSVCANASQFIATLETGHTVTWGIDPTHFAILQCDGNFQIPVSSSVFSTLRKVNADVNNKFKLHGVYDSRHELNCMWLRTLGSTGSPNLLVFQHAASGAWGTSYEHDLTASAAVEDTTTNEILILGGTSSGHFGQLFVKDFYSNWLTPNSANSGLVNAFNSSTKILTTINALDNTDKAWIGSWVLITSSTGDSEQWARVAAVTAFNLTFDLFYVPLVVEASLAPIHPIDSTSRFYAGLIDCSVLQQFDLKTPTTNKSIEEMWATMMNVDTSVYGLFTRFYYEYDRTNGLTVVPPRDTRLDGSPSNTWCLKTEIPSDLAKSWGIEFIERGYQAWQLVNFTFKFST